MRNLIAGWVIKGKTLCADCISMPPEKIRWKLIHRDECSNKHKHNTHHKKAA